MVLKVTCVLQAAKDRSDQLQQQLAQRGTDLREAQAQCVKLQEDLTGKCGEVTAEKQEQAALQMANHDSVKASIHIAETLRYPHTLLPSPHLPIPPWLP